MPGLSGVQSRLNRAVEFCVFWSDSAFEAVDHCAVLADEEFLEIPLHSASRFRLIEGGVRLCGASGGMHLVKQLEGGAVRGRAEALDFFKAAGFLGTEVVAGKSQNTEALISVLVLKSLESCILFGEAAAAGHVHDQQNLARIGAEGFLAAVRGPHGHAADAGSHWH